MATFTTTDTQSGAVARYSAAGDVIYANKYVMTATASTSDVIQLVKVQPGARVVNIRTWVNSATPSYSVGDGDDTGKFMNTASAIVTPIAAPTASTVATVIRNINVGAGLAYSYSVADTIDLKFDISGGGATTTLYYVVELVYDQQFQV